MNKFYAVLFGFGLFCFSGSLISALEQTSRLKAGAAKINITPLVETFEDTNRNGHYDEGEPFEDLYSNGKWDPVWLAGYQGSRYAKGVHDELTARALVFTEGKETILIITLDIIGYLFDEVTLVKKEIAKKFGIRPSRILISSTHNHSGPDTIGLWGHNGKSGKDEQYMKWLRKQIVKCVQIALNDRKPASLSFGKTKYSKPIEDSRPPKVINDLLLSMHVQDDRKQTIATFVNFAMHAEVLNGKNRDLTADYPGELRKSLEKEFGGVALFVPADIGGMQSPYVLLHNFWSSKRVGGALAEEVIDSLKNKESKPNQSIAIKRRSILFPIENPRFLKAIENNLFGNSKKFITKKGNKIFLPASVTLLTIGEAQFLTVPGELFPELGHPYRARMKTDYPFLIGLCNNEIGYIVPQEAWNEKGYEESVSLGPKTAQILTEKVHQLLPSK